MRPIGLIEDASDLMIGTGCTYTMTINEDGEFSDRVNGFDSR